MKPRFDSLMLMPPPRNSKNWSKIWPKVMPLKNIENLNYNTMYNWSTTLQICPSNSSAPTPPTKKKNVNGSNNNPIHEKKEEITNINSYNEGEREKKYTFGFLGMPPTCSCGIRCSICGPCGARSTIRVHLLTEKEKQNVFSGM